MSNSTPKLTGAVDLGRMGRRRFLQGGLAAAALVLPLARRGLWAAVPSGAEGLTTYQLGPRVWVRWNNRLLTCYRAHPSQKYPYLYPLAGPLTGLSLTSETSLPYPHHRSVFFGCDRLNGANFWQEDYGRGQIISAGPTVRDGTRDSVRIQDACEWRQPGSAAVMTDRRQITVTVAGEQAYYVDWEIEWTAVVEVQVQKTNHSLFAVRAAAELTPHGGGRLVNAAGQEGEKATFGQPAAWCDFSGGREGIGGAITEGIALMDHPENPLSPSPWFTRDYGFMSPTPFNFMASVWKLPAGESVRLRYRLVMHAGRPEEAGLAAIHRAWVG